jgi:hypothetical protein
MKYITHSHRNGLIIFQDVTYKSIWENIHKVISDITEEDLIAQHNSYSGVMSLSHAINQLLRDRFIVEGWHPESPIFQNDQYQGDKWRLDFAKAPVSIEVGFNHGEAISWNLLKPVMASELNHINKAIQTELAVVITATSALKQAGAFDSAVGEYEKYLDYLLPMQNQLTTPMVIIGLLPPETFVIEKQKNPNTNRNTGSVRRI